MRRFLPWLFALPLVVAGTETAHAVGYWLAVPDAHTRAHVLEQSGHAYFRYAPLALALGGAAIFAGLALTMGAGSRVVLRVRAWPFALLPGLTFVLQEQLERLLHGGVFSPSTMLERSFVAGCLLQLPFGLAAFLLARTLLRLAVALARFARRPPPRRRPVLPVRLVHASALLPRPVALATGCGVRGPPPPR